MVVLGGVSFLTVPAAFAVGFHWSNRSRAAFAAGFLNLLIAGMNSVAPFRGLLDPHYVGYRFGLVSASQGVLVFLIAGTVLVCAGAAAYLAARNRPGRSMIFVAVIDAAFSLNMSIGTVVAALGARDFEIQFGEYLTIPSAAGLVISLLVFLLPLLATVRWALRRTHPLLARSAPLTVIAVC